MESRKEKAKELFLQGYNCTQAVVLAFEDLLPPESRDQIVCMSSSMGGGMGRLREVCGCVSGMFLIAGLLYGYSGPEKGEIKAEHYARIQELARRFEQANGSIVCRELLGLDVKRQSPVPEARTEEYYRKRPCMDMAGMAAQILDDFIKEQEQAGDDPEKQ